MARIVILLLVVVPALEIWGLIAMGKRIGGWQTFALIVLTGLFGAWLARREFGRVWAFARQQYAYGEIPTQAILDGICVFIGGLLLVIPGFLTDIVGLAMLLPPSRAFFRDGLSALIRKKLLDGTFHFFYRR